MIAEAADFLAECRAIEALVAPLPAAAYDTRTAFKDWSVDEILRHLHFWDRAAGLALGDPEAFQAMLGELRAATKAGATLRAHEAATLQGVQGPELVRRWITYAETLAAAYGAADPAQRVPWGGPSMSARSLISARLMETWAHAQAIYDVLGVVRRNEDRIRSIVVLGVNTYGWTFATRKVEPPGARPTVELTAPSGAVWTYPGEGDGLVAGAAEEFCQVVTQTRNVADTQLRVEGAAARTWMENAQCFAGPPNPPPAPGVRATAAKAPTW